MSGLMVYLIGWFFVVLFVTSYLLLQYVPNISKMKQGTVIKQLIIIAMMVGIPLVLLMIGLVPLLLIP